MWYSGRSDVHLFDSKKQVIMLRVRNVRVRYEREVLKGVDIECSRGEVVAVLGRNGSGKSTLLKAILGDVGYSGEIEIDGQCVSSMTDRIRARHIAVVEQNVPRVPIKIREYVEMGRMPYRGLLSMGYSEDDKTIVEETLDTLGIKHLASKRMDRVSGGEGQLASIAQAISQEPDVLLLDEPGSNLDIVNKYEMYRVVREVTKMRNMVTIVVVHELSSVKRFADKVLMLKDGVVVAFGKVQEELNKANLDRVYGVEIEKIADI